MNEHELTVIETPRQLATRISPMDALAVMSDAEFRLRLDQMKVAQVRMATIQRELMIPEIDYGVIPGTGSKPTLLKPGAEKLAKFHRLVPTFTQTTILGDGVSTPHLRVLTVCSLHAETDDGPIVGQGLGATNSWETKHRWRNASRQCPHCGAAAIVKGKEEYGGGWLCFAKKGGCGAKFGSADPAITDQQIGMVENPDPFDTENTLEKMSAKRSYVDATLRATATSGLFSQDLEDIAESGSSPAKAPARPVQREARPPSAPTSSDEAAVPNFATEKDLLAWAHEKTGLGSKAMYEILGVENMLQIKAKYSTFAAAAEVLLKNIPPSEEIL